MWWSLLVPCLLAVISVLVYKLWGRTLRPAAGDYVAIVAVHRKARDGSWLAHGAGNAILVRSKLKAAIEFIDRLDCVNTGMVQLREADGMVVYDMLLPGPSQIEFVVDVRNNIYLLGQPRGTQTSSYTYPPMARLLATTMATWGEDYDKALEKSTLSRVQFHWDFKQHASRALRLFEQVLGDMSPVS